MAVPPAPQQGKRWCFTIHAMGGDEAALRALFARMAPPEWGVYGGAQLERAPSTGALHIQGFCVFAVNMRLGGAGSGLKKLHPTAHWARMHGSLESNEEYCSKDDTREPGTEPRRWGDRPPTNGQGRRTDLDDAVEALRAATGSVTARMRAAASVAPTAVVKFTRGLEFLARLEAPAPKYAWPAPRVWQARLLDTLAAEPDDRHILWFVDESGGAGKSTFVRKYLSDNAEDAIVLSGKIADMAYAYDSQRVVFFDVSRTQAEHMDHLYSFAETLKNGMCNSNKYESKLKLFKPPHVVFFANMEPAAGKWSADRLRLHRLDWRDIQVAASAAADASPSPPPPSSTLDDVGAGAGARAPSPPPKRARAGAARAPSLALEEEYELGEYPLGPYRPLSDGVGDYTAYDA